VVERAKGADFEWVFYKNKVEIGGI